MDFFKYIHAVGTGKKGNRDLTFEESKDMMTQMLNQNIPKEQISAFLLGWRLKPESTEEFCGAIDSFDLFLKKTTVPNSLELGYPFDGKVNNPYLFPLIANFVKDFDLNLILSGDDLVPAKNGTTIKDIATSIDLQSNIHYFDRKDFFSEMSALSSIRKNLGLRTGLNTIEKLTKVANSEYAITGVFHKPYVNKYIDIFSSNYKTFTVIQGNEGTPELFSKGRLWLSKDGEVKEFIVDPKYYGVEFKKSFEYITKDESVEFLSSPSEEIIKLAKVNSAIYLFVTGNANSIDEGFEKLNG